MKRSSLSAVVFATLLLASPILGQEEECNNCGYPPECGPFSHWVNCGYSGPGFDFTGYCGMGGQCNPLDCSVYMDFWGCEPEETPGPDPQDLLAVLDGSVSDSREPNLLVLLKQARVRLEDLNRDRGVLYLRACDGSSLLGQLILEPASADQLTEVLTGLDSYVPDFSGQ